MKTSSYYTPTLTSRNDVTFSQVDGSIYIVFGLGYVASHIGFKVDVHFIKEKSTSGQVSFTIDSQTPTDKLKVLSTNSPHVSIYAVLHNDSFRYVSPVIDFTEDIFLDKSVKLNVDKADDVTSSKISYTLNSGALECDLSVVAADFGSFLAKYGDKVQNVVARIQSLSSDVDYDITYSMNAYVVNTKSLLSKYSVSFPNFPTPVFQSGDNFYNHFLITFSFSLLGYNDYILDSIVYDSSLSLTSDKLKDEAREAVVSFSETKVTKYFKYERLPIDANDLGTSIYRKYVDSDVSNNSLSSSLKVGYIDQSNPYPMVLANKINGVKTENKSGQIWTTESDKQTKEVSFFNALPVGNDLLDDGNTIVSTATIFKNLSELKLSLLSHLEYDAVKDEFKTTKYGSNFSYNCSIYEKTSDGFKFIKTFNSSDFTNLGYITFAIDAGIINFTQGSTTTEYAIEYYAYSSNGSSDSVRVSLKTAVAGSNTYTESVSSISHALDRKHQVFLAEQKYGFLQYTIKNGLSYFDIYSGQNYLEYSATTSITNIASSKQFVGVCCSPSSGNIRSATNGYVKSLTFDTDKDASFTNSSFDVSATSLLKPIDINYLTSSYNTTHNILTVIFKLDIPDDTLNIDKINIKLAGKTTVVNKIKLNQKIYMCFFDILYADLIKQTIEIDIIHSEVDAISKLPFSTFYSKGLGYE